MASSALNVTIDTTAPIPTILFSTDSGRGDGITNDNALTLAGTAEAGSTVKVYDGATLLGSALASGTGAWSYTTAVLPNGGHSLTATATDAAGNTGVASSALNVTIDTTAPTTPTITSFSTDSGVVGDGITNDNALTLAGTAEAGSTVKVYDGATLLGSALASGTGAWSYTTAVLPNGGHSLTATATDAAGNTGAASSALNVTIDTTAPAAPVITGDTIVNTNEMMLTGTAEANSKVTIFEGSMLLGTATANDSGAWSYTTKPLSDGSHAFTATASDLADNTSAPSQILDPIVGGTIIESNGSISLTQVGDQYYLYDSTGGGPSLKFFGIDHLADRPGLAGVWTPISAEKTATGYEVAWKAAGTNQYTIWNTDNNGNYVSNIGVVSGNSPILQAFENSFHQDLNGDGRISPPVTVLDGHLGNQTLTAAGGPTVLVGGPRDTLNGGAGADMFVFPQNFGADTVKNFTPGTDALVFSQAMFANVAAVLADAHQVGSDVVIAHDPQNVVTLQNVQLTNLHASDFHLV